MPAACPGFLLTGRSGLEQGLMRHGHGDFGVGLVLPVRGPAQATL
jgi:hypothetical protein